jgi:hypothetical protein
MTLQTYDNTREASDAGERSILDELTTQHVEGTPCPIECEAIAAGDAAPRRAAILRRLAPSLHPPKAALCSPAESVHLGDDTRLLIVPRSLIERAAQIREKMKVLGIVRRMDEWGDAEAFVNETTEMLVKAIGLEDQT